MITYTAYVVVPDGGLDKLTAEYGEQVTADDLVDWLAAGIGQLREARVAGATVVVRPGVHH